MFLPQKKILYSDAEYEYTEIVSNEDLFTFLTKQVRLVHGLTLVKDE